MNKLQLGEPLSETSVRTTVRNQKTETSACAGQAPQ